MRLREYMPMSPPEGSTDPSDRPPAEGDAVQEAGERAARNTAVRAAGEIIGKLGSLVLFAVLAREVGDARLGIFVFALAWAEVAMTPVGLGIDQFLLRQVAEDRTRLDSYYWNALYLKLLRGVPVVVGSIVLVYVLDYSTETRQTVAIITIALLFETLARTLVNVFNAFERGELVAYSIVLQRLSSAALGLALLFAGYGVVAVALAYLLGAVLRLIQSFYLLHRRLGTPRRVLPADVRLVIRKRSLTFTAQDIFGLVLARADVLLLAALASDSVVGLYGSAYRLFEATTFINIALTGAFTAMFTYLGRDTTPPLASVFQRSVKLLLALQLPIAVSLGLLAEPLCVSFFGEEFRDSADPLRILAPVVVLFGVMVLASVLVLSRSRPKRMVYTVAVASVINIVLNLVLIPPYGEVGAALAMLGSLAVYAAIALVLAVIETGPVNWLSMTGPPLLAAAVMAVPLLLLSGVWPIALLVGTVVYAAAYAAIERVVEPDDLQFVVDLIKRRLPGRSRATEAV
jgi:O-antigen/teichoic acid export membrane protein